MAQLVLELSQEAQELVESVLADETEPESLALWVEVAGQDGASYNYDVYFQALADAGVLDAIVEQKPGLRIVVPQGSVDRLRGSKMEVSTDDGGLVIINPNSPEVASSAPEGLEDATLEGDLARRIIDILADEVNPQIASHGGRADLVGVNGTIVYLRLSGGCQGCGLASVTLSQGIEVAIRDVAPEVTEVVDVTDHLSGTNPYYQSSKK